MRKIQFAVCLLALGGAFVGCVAPTSGTDPVVTSEVGDEPASTPATPALDADGEPAVSPYAATGEPEPAVTSDGPAGPDQAAAPTYTAEATDSVQAQIAQLASLELFEVQELLTSIPGERYSCPYNVPCAGAEQDDVLRRQGARLAGLLAIAEDVRETDELPAATRPAEEHLAALRSLSIVGIGQLIVDEPASSPECYNLPCPDDVEAAEASNARRAAELAALDERAAGL